jgi:hypothetical protein
MNESVSLFISSTPRKGQTQCITCPWSSGLVNHFVVDHKILYFDLTLTRLLVKVSVVKRLERKSKSSSQSHLGGDGKSTSSHSIVIPHGSLTTGWLHKKDLLTRFFACKSHCNHHGLDLSPVTSILQTWPSKKSTLCLPHTHVSPIDTFPLPFYLSLVSLTMSTAWNLLSSLLLLSGARKENPGFSRRGLLRLRFHELLDLVS